MTRTYFRRIEERYLAKGFDWVIGIDEVGRGPLAGPMVLGLVVFCQKLNNIKGLNDSKKLSEKKRDELVQNIEKVADYSIGSVSAREIDKIGLTAATELAIDRGLGILAKRFDLMKAMILMDGNFKYKTNFGQVETIIKGDSKVRVIAAASNVAKVFRDNLMKKADVTYPGYNFKKNVGYGTKEHRDAIIELGVCPLHRKSFLSKINGS